MDRMHVIVMETTHVIVMDGMHIMDRMHVQDRMHVMVCNGYNTHNGM